MANSCPTCHRRSTWSAKWQSCSACSEPEPYEREPLMQYGVHLYGTDDPQTANVLQNAPGVTKLTTGRPRKFASDADRQRAYRQRKASTS